jgi:pimeloyl-ACP methyl ester carboxylesterase/DNA-binding CsgD family transcriptional regulator
VQQRIGFVETAHGSVAYAIVGRGPALLFDTGWVSHLSYIWQAKQYRAFFERLAAEHQLILYDKPGAGLSDRERSDFSIEPDVEALEAIVRDLGLERLAMVGMSQGGPVCAVFTARHPHLVDRLVFYGSFARGAALSSPSFQASLVELTRSAWGLGARTMTELFVPGAERAEHDWFTRGQREAADAETAARLLEGIFRIDVTADLARITCPVLVLHREGERAIPFSAGRELAALLPGAKFEPLPGSAHMPYMGDSESVTRAILDFVDADRGPAATTLTAREMAVALLVAEGLTNAEIAARLLLAPRTVDAHLEHIRGKLGMRSRAQVAVWAAAHH